MKRRRDPQLELLKDQPKSYGGELLTTRKARSYGRPIDTRNTMHLVLRSSKAKGDWSFKRPQNEKKIVGVIARFSQKYGIRILSLANVGNHLHFQIKVANRYAYYSFIRAITGAIAMAVTGASRWNPLAKSDKKSANDRFWDYRPFTRVVVSLRAFLNLRDYIRINQLEGFGYARSQARFIAKAARTGFSSA